MIPSLEDLQSKLQGFTKWAKSFWQDIQAASKDIMSWNASNVWSFAQENLQDAWKEVIDYASQTAKNQIDNSVVYNIWRKSFNAWLDLTQDAINSKPFQSILDTGKSIIDNSWNLVEFWFNQWTKFAEKLEDSGSFFSKKNRVDVTWEDLWFSDEEYKYVWFLETETWMDRLKETAWIFVWSWKEIITSNNVEKLLKDDVSSKDFNTEFFRMSQNITEINKELDRYVKSSGKYGSYVKFNNEYSIALAKWLSDEDAQAEAASKLSPLELENLESQYNSLSDDVTVKSLQETIEWESTKLTSFVSKSIITPEWEDSLATIQKAYDLDASSSKELTEREEFNTYQSNKVEKELLDIISEDSILFTSNDMFQYKDKTVEKLVSDRWYLVWLTASLKDNKYKWQLLNLVKESNDVRKEYYVWLLTEIARVRKENPTWKNKQIERVAMNSAYDSLSDYEQKVFQNRKELLNQVKFTENSNQIWDDLANFFEAEDGLIVSWQLKQTWKILYNILWNAWLVASTLTHKGTEWLDRLHTVVNAFDDESTYNLTAESRSILQADNNLAEKVIGTLAYNMDEVAAMTLGIAAINKIKFPNIQKLVNLAKVNPVRLQWTIWRWTLSSYNTVIWATGKMTSWAAEWQASGAVVDSILDATLQEPWVKSLQEMNMLMNFIFDTWAPVLWKTLLKTSKYTSNSAMYKFMTADKKSAIKDFIDVKAQQGITISPQQAVQVMRSWEKFYKTILDIPTLKSLRKDGSLFNFISEWLKEIDQTWVDSLLTGKWLWIEVQSNILPFDIWNYQEISKNLYGSDIKKSEFASGVINKKLNEVWAYLKWNTIFNGNRLQNVSEKEIKIVNNLIDNIRTAKTKKTFLNLYDELESTLNKITAEKGIIKNEATIKLTNLTTWEIFTIKRSDLEKLENSNVEKWFNSWIIKIENLDDPKLEQTLGKSKEFTITKDNDLNRATSYINSDDMNNRIDLLIKEVLPEYTQKEYIALSQEIKQNLRNLLTLSWKSWARISPKYWDLVPKFIVDSVTEFYGPARATDISLWDTLVARNKVIEKAGSKDSDFVVAWGRAKYDLKWNVNKSWQDNYLINVYPWKRLQERIPTLDPSINTNASEYTQTFETVRRMIHNFAEGRDYESAIKNVEAIEYYGKFDSLLSEWKINEKWARWLIKNIGARVWSNEIQIKQAEKIIMPLIAKLEEVDPYLIGTMITSYTYKHLENFELINKLLSEKNFKWDAISIFADILVNPKMYDEISKKMDIQSDDILKAHLRNEFSSWKNITQAKLDSARDSLRFIENELRTAKDFVYLNDLEKSKADISAKAEDLKKILKTNENSYINAHIDYMRNKDNISFLKDVARDVASKHKYKDQLVTNLTLVKNKIQEYKALAKLNKTQKWLLTRYSNQIKEAVSNKNFQINDLYDIKERILKSTMDDDLKDHVVNLIDEIFTTDTKTVYIDTQKILDDAANFDNEIFTEEFIKKQNPVVKNIKAFINNNDTGRNSTIDNIIYSKFWLEEWRPMSYHYDNNPTFKKFIDWFQIDNEKLSGWNKFYWEFIKEITDWLKIQAKDSNGVVKDVTADVIKDLLSDPSVYQSFKRIARTTTYTKTIIEDWVTSFKEESIEKIMYHDELLSDGVNPPMTAKFIPWVDESFVATTRYEKWDIRAFYSKNIDPTIDGKLVSDSEIYADVKRMFNDWDTDGIVWAFLSKLNINIDYDSHIFTGWFWDKSSYFGIYTNKDISSKKWFKDILKDIYTIEYAIKSGMLKEAYTYKEFLADLWKKEFDSYADFRKSLDPIVPKLEQKLENVKTLYKRESTLQSQYKTFDKVDKELDFLILPEIIWEDAFTNAIKNIDSEKTFDEVLNQLRNSDLTDIQRSDLEYYAAQSKDVNAFITTLKGTYLTNFQDGTSFTSKNVWEMRSKITWDKKSIKQFKDHLTGMTKDGIRYLSKTNFNVVDIKYWDKTDDIVVSNIDALKLYGWVDPEKLIYDQEVIINGKKYLAAKAPYNVNTQDFVNATQASQKSKTKETASFSIMNRLDAQYLGPIFDLMKWKMAEEFDVTKNMIGSYVTGSSLFWTSDTINKTAQRMNVGSLNDATLWSQLSDFLSRVNAWLTKPKWDGQSLIIQEATDLISPEEMAVSKNSNIYKIAVKQMSDKIVELNLSKELNEFSDKRIWEVDAEVARIQSDLDNWNIYAVGYRYPVPSEFNLGTYKIKVIEDTPELMKEYWDIGWDRVILNPHSVFMKLEWDFDADKVTFLTTYWEIGNVFSKASMARPADETLADFHEYLKSGAKNRYIVADQVEASKWKNISIFSGRDASMIAKENVWVVSATGRTISIISSILKEAQRLKSISQKEYDKYLQTPFVAKEIQWKKLVDKTYTYKDLMERFNLFSTSKDYLETYASVLQVTLDFAKSGLSSFDKTWYIKLMKKTWLQEEDIVRLYNEIISPLSKTQWNDFILKPNNFVFTKDFSVNGKIDIDAMHAWIWSKNKYFQSLYKNLVWKIWFERKLSEDFIRDYWDFINKTNSIWDPAFVFNQWKDVNPTIKKAHDKYFTKYQYLSADSKKKLFQDIEKNNLWMTPEIHAQVITWNIIDEEARQIFALKELTDGKYHIFDILSDADKYAYLSFYDDVKMKNIESFDIQIEKVKDISELKPLAIQMSDEIGKLKKSKWAPEEIEMLENKRSIIQSQINKLDDIEDEVLLSQSKAKANIVSGNRAKDYELFDKKWFDYSSMATAEEIEKVYDMTGAIEQHRKSHGKFIVSHILWKHDFNLLSDLNFYTNTAARMKLYKTLVKQNKFIVDMREMLKKSWMNSVDAEDSWRMISSVMTEWFQKSWNTYAYVRTKSFEQKINNLFTKSWKGWVKSTTDVAWSKEFQSLIKWFEADIIPDVLWAFNEFQRLKPTFNIFTHYNIDNKNLWSLIDDVLASSKSDFNFWLKMNGYYSRWAFQDDFLGKWVNKKDTNTLANTLYSVDTELQKYLNMLKSVYYSQRYGSISAVAWQNWYIAALTQMIPNLAELVAVMKNFDDERVFKARVILDKMNLLASEDSLRFSGGWDIELETFNKSFDKALNWVYNKLISKVWVPKELYDDTMTFVTNPLAASDALFDRTRKVAAILDTMDTLGIKTEEDLYRKLQSPEFKAFFETKMRQHYAWIGGWVISSSQLERHTRITRWDFFGDTGTDKQIGLLWNKLFLRFGANLFWFLNGWAFTKNFRLVQQSMSLAQAIRNINNPRVASAHFSDFMKHSMEQVHISLMAAWFYMKLEKYNDDPEKNTSLKDFILWFNNSAVASSILFWQLYWETMSDKTDMYINEDLSDPSITDKAQYSAANHIRRYMRTITNIWTIWKIYDHYRSSDDPDIMNSIIEVSKNVSLWFTRFNGLVDADDMYNTLSDNSWVQMFWLWIPNTEAQINEVLQQGTRYANFERIWFFPSLFKMVVVSPFVNPIIQWDYMVLQKAAYEDIERLKKRESIQQIFNYGLSWENGYKLSNILGTLEWDTLEKAEQYLLLDQTQKNNIDTLFSLVWYNEVKNTLDSKGYDQLEYREDGTPLWNPMPDTLITESLEAILQADWMTFEDVFNDPKWINSNAAMKAIALLSVESNINTGLIVQKLVDAHMDKRWKDLKDYKQQTPKGYSQLPEEIYSALKYEALQKYKEFITLDGPVMEWILDMEIKTNNMDVIKNVDKYRDENATNIVSKGLVTDYIVNNGLKEWNTSVAKLKSRLALSTSYIPDGQQWLEIALRYADMIDTSTMWPQAKVAHKAALFMWLKKDVQELIRDNEKFETILSPDVRRWVSNVLYDISESSIQLDNNSFSNQVNYAWYTKRNKSGWYSYNPSNFSSFKQPFKSNSYEWGRPNFSDQVAPIRDMLEWKEWYISDNPRKFIQTKKTGQPQSFRINPMKFANVKAYNKYVIQAMVEDFFSKDIIKQAPNKIAQIRKNLIKIRKQKSLKPVKLRPIRRTTRSWSRWLLPNLPLSRNND